MTEPASFSIKHAQERIEGQFISYLNEKLVISCDTVSKLVKLFFLAKRDITSDVMQQIMFCHASFVLARRDAVKDGSRDWQFVLAKRDTTRDMMQQVTSWHASFVLARRDEFRDGSRDR